MPERAAGGDAVAHALLDLPHLGEATPLLARPDDLAVDAELETPPVASGVRVTEPTSCAKVVNSSCAIQPARRPQPHSRQYTISMAGVLGMALSKL